MENKYVLLGFASVLGLLILASLVVGLSISNPFSVSLSNSTNSGSVSVSGDDLFNVTTSLPVSKEDSTNKVKFTLTNTTAIINVTSATFTISAQELSDVGFLDTYSVAFELDSVNASNSSDTDKFNITASYQNTEYCSETISNNIDVEITDIITQSGLGDDDNYWYPMDDVEIEVKVSYDGSDTKDEFQNGELSWAIYTSDGKQIMDGTEDIADIEDGDDDTVYISFRVDPDDFDSEVEDYILYISATGEEDYSESSKSNADICASSDPESIDLRVNDDFVTLDNLELSSGLNTTQCGEEIQINGDVWNIGSDKQKEVSVRVYSSELGLNKYLDVGDISAFDNEVLPLLSFKIPENATAKTYTIRFEVLDESGDIYENNDDDVSSSFAFPLKVEGTCGLPSSTLSISIPEAVEGISGKDLVVKTSITNLGTSIVSLTLSPKDYSGWASSMNVEPQVLILGAGETKEASFTFKTKEDVSGDKTFNLEVLSSGKVVSTKPFSVTLSESSNIFTGLIDKIKSGVGASWYLWLIGAINLILIIVIIVVAVKVARK